MNFSIGLLTNDNTPIIDAHHHFWDLSLKKHPWLDGRQNIKNFRYGDYSKICKNYLLEDYKKEIVTSKTYDNDANGQRMFSEMLLVDRSNERIRKLSRRLSKKVSADSRSREDIDSFFFSVNLKEARNLKPALDYVSQKNFDIFILNSWNTNDNYQPLEKDLIGSIHSDMPIMMPILMPKYIAEVNRTREFAIGYDAFEIILLRYGSINSKNFVYKGLTGKISLDRKKHKRSPYLFEITDKGIKVL